MGKEQEIMTTTVKKPWVSPQIIEIEIKMTENGGGLGIDVAGQGVDPMGFS